MRRIYRLRRSVGGFGKGIRKLRRIGYRSRRLMSRRKRR